MILSRVERYQGREVRAELLRTAVVDAVRFRSPVSIEPYSRDLRSRPLSYLRIGEG